MPTEFQVLIIDRHPIDALGIRKFLNDTEFSVTGVIQDVEELEDAVADQKPNLVLCEINLPDSMELIDRLKPIQPDIKVVYFSANRNPVLLNQIRKQNGGGALDKNVGEHEFVESLRKVMETGSCWTRETSRQIVGALSATRVHISNEAALTKREHDVLRHVSSGKTNQDIAKVVGISYETVKEHVQNILKKLHVSDRTQAAIWMIRQHQENNGSDDPRRGDLS